MTGYQSLEALTKRDRGEVFVVVFVGLLLISAAAGAAAMAWVVA